MRQLTRCGFVVGGMMLMTVVLILLPKPYDGFNAEPVLNAVVHIKALEGWQGSGVLISNTMILTAKHVIRDCDEFEITFRDGTKVTAQHTFYMEDVDVGFIILDKSVNIECLKFAKSKLRIGETIYCVGHPFGTDAGLEWTVTRGIISAIDRIWPELIGPKQSIQIDAVAYPGNSGGPVVNENGEIVGIVCGGWDSSLVGCVPYNVIEEVLRCYEQSGDK